MRWWPTATPSSDAGPIAPDGSAVAMYAALPAERAVAAMLHRALPPAGSVLDLGAGTGRLAGPLAALGHPVVAVDNSPQMLARVPAGIDTVCADIGTLALPDRSVGWCWRPTCSTMPMPTDRDYCGPAAGTCCRTVGCSCNGSRRSSTPACAPVAIAPAGFGSGSSSRTGWMPTGWR